MERYKSLFKEGRTSQMVPKYSIKNRYNRMTVESTNTMGSFNKPNFNMIDDDVELLDNGNIIVTIGGDRFTNSQSQWWELS